ncbi:gamma-tubulin complex component 5-like [Amphibalanus amphitrite]|uniref:gamma-tubulin complex component 5-like n=1 Tax=Amphibalanus amphitrite TaxID=1232801 RepID=UPI001C91A542|nr:gamma-tubulin complex component 5-like [Amphibalanus amphitrite]XP_043228463.1 gamma-tubulin complex component 5-like [Amphibalanus amphitrite]
MAAAAKSRAIEKDVDGLIACVTGFSETLEKDEENFELCRRYVLSNIYYHRYLDTNSHEVRRQLRGLATKFRVHALPGLAERLETLWKRLVEARDWSEHAQWDIEWRLLSLLVNLSNNPTSVASRPRAAPGQQPLAAVSEGGEEQDQEVDWRKELLLPEEEYSPYQSPEEWSDLDGDDDINISPPPVHVVRFSRSSLLLPGVEVGRPSAGRPQPLADEGDPLTWLEEHISRPYQPVELGPGPLRPSPDAAETYHALQVRLGLAGPTDLSVLTEWSVCRELVWQLLSPADSSLLQCRDGQFRPTGRFRVHGLTQAALSSQLSRFCAPVTAVGRLRGFIRSPGPLSTHRAFARSLAAHLEGLDAELVTLETELQKQEVTLTLRGIQRRLSAWFCHLAELDRLLQRGVLSVPDDRPGWVRAARLVSVLYEAVDVCADPRWSPALVRLFLDTVQPMVAVVSGWTVLETDPDPNREFLIQRNEETAVTDPQYWASGFTVNSNFHDYWTDGVEPLPFLLPHLDQLVQTAKCLRILCHLKLTDHLDDSSLQEEFNSLVSEALSKADESSQESEQTPGFEDSPQKSANTLSNAPKSSESTHTSEAIDPGKEPKPGKPVSVAGDSKAASAAVFSPAPPSAAVSADGPEGSDAAGAETTGDAESVSAAGTATTVVTASESPEGGPQETATEKHPMAADAPKLPSVESKDSPDDRPARAEAPAHPQPAAEDALSDCDSGRGSEEAPSPPPPRGPAAPPGGMLQELLVSFGSPYLSAAFEEALYATDRGRDTAPEAPKKRSAPPVRLTTSIPHIMCSALSGPLAARQASVCRRMVTALRSDFQLGEHLRMLRRVFLMEADDLMAQFTLQLCDTLASDSDSDESVSLTLCLEDCVSARYPEQAARLSVTVQHPAERELPLLQRLATVTLGYSVPWPCTIVITDSCLERYNAMFRFILQLKFTLRALHTLKFEDLDRCAGTADSSTQSPLDLDRSEPVPRASRVLRLQLLRAWLLHFVGSIHSYIMMRVLHSTWLELEEQLEKAADVDAMAQMHQLYLGVLLRRCLLSGSAERTLHAAVQSALHLSGRLQLLWTAAGQLPEAELLKLEADYVRCHHFTAGLLRQYRQTMGHVDSLAAAMAHSAPGQISYDELV